MTNQHDPPAARQDVPPRSATEAARTLERIKYEIKKVIVGQDQMVERLLLALLAPAAE